MYVINKKEKIYSTVVLLSVASHRGLVWTQGPSPAGDWTWTYNLGLDLGPPGLGLALGQSRTGRIMINLVDLKVHTFLFLDIYLH